jgi:hypothetical protein
MGGKGSMPAMPAPMMMPAPKESDYLPPKTELPEPAAVTQAKLDDEKRRKMARLASTDTRENTIINDGGALGLGATTEEEVNKPSLFYKKKVVGNKSEKGLLSS